jgi:hypothetical protein
MSAQKIYQSNVPLAISITKLRNTSTAADLLSVQAKNPSGPKSTLVELHPKGFGLEAAQGLCLTGQNLQITLELSHKAPKVVFDCTAKVTQVHTLPDQKVRLDLKLVQYEKGTWKTFLSHFGTLQDHVSNLFQTLKG